MVKKQNGRQKQDGRPFENWTFASGFRMAASLDRFIKKRVMNKIFFMPKWSSLAGKKVRSGFRMDSEIELKLCLKRHHSKTGRFGIRWGTVSRYSTICPSLIMCVIRTVFD